MSGLMLTCTKYVVFQVALCVREFPKRPVTCFKKYVCSIVQDALQVCYFTYRTSAGPWFFKCIFYVHVVHLLPLGSWRISAKPVALKARYRRSKRAGEWRHGKMCSCRVWLACSTGYVRRCSFPLLEFMFFIKPYVSAVLQVQLQHILCLYWHQINSGLYSAKWKYGGRICKSAWRLSR